MGYDYTNTGDGTQAKPPPSTKEDIMTTTHLGNAAVILGYNNLPYPLEDAFTAGMGDHRDS